MVKSINKYKKWILVIGGTFLMVAWLLPQSVNSLVGDPRKKTVASVAGRGISGMDLVEYESEYRALKRFLPTGLNLPAQDAEHYMLLVEEAERAGLVGGEGEGEGLALTDENAALIIAFDQLRNLPPQFISQFLPQQASQLLRSEDGRKQIAQVRDQQMPGMIAGICGESNLRLDQFHRALSRQRGIVRLTNGVMLSARVSDRRVIASARDAANGATISHVIVPADHLIAKMPAPTGEEITAHYERYKAAGAADDPSGLGYRKPPRVKLEWIEVNKAQLALSIRLIDTHVRERWNQRNPGGTQEMFDKGRVAMEEQLRNEYAEDLLRLVDGRFRELAGDAARKLPMEGRLRKLPDDWKSQRLTMQDLAAALVAAVKSETAARDDRERWQSPVEIPSPIVHEDTGWLTSAGVTSSQGFGTAQLQLGTQRVRTADLVLQTRELTKDSTIPLQMGVIPVFDRSVTDAKGNLFYFRVLAVRPEGEPESIEEVRPDVVKDLKRLKAYEQLKSEFDNNLGLARIGGLDAVVSAYPTDEIKIEIKAPEIAPVPSEPLQIRRDVKVTKGNVQGDAALNTQEFRDAVLLTAGALDPKTLATNQPGDARTLGALLPKSLSTVFARIDALDPLTVERLRASGRQAAMNVMITEASALTTGPAAPFSLESMKARLKYINYVREAPAEAPGAPPAKP